jgi:hypothetical protein
VSRWVAVLAASLLLGACSSEESNAEPSPPSEREEDGASTATTTTTTQPPAPLSTPPAPVSSDPQRGTVRIDDDVFGWGDDLMTFSNESILVNSSGPRPALVEALNRAALRFMHVDERGTEHGPEVEEAPPIGPDGQELYTPNYVSAPTETPAGVHMYVDCKGVIDPRMRSRFLLILQEELGGLGGDVTVAVAE